MSNQHHQCYKLILDTLGADISAKSIKTGFGHDRSGAMCTVLFKNKPAFEFHDDGYGGDSEIKMLDSTVYEALHQQVKAKKIGTIMFENGWKFMETVDAISLHSIMDEIASALIYKRDIDAGQKKLLKRTEKAFVIVDSAQESYMEYAFKGYPLLSDVKKHPKGVEFLQRRYADALKGAQENKMSLLNTPAQLTALGIAV